jgi:hypothetical protein
MVLTSYDPYKTKSTERRIAVFFCLNADAREQSNPLSTGKSLKAKEVSTKIKPHPQQNDEP